MASTFCIMMCTLIVAVVFGAAPACEEDNPSPLASDINARMKSAMASREAAINNDIKSQLANKPNLLPAPFRVKKTGKFPIPGYDNLYGYDGHVNSLVIKDNAVKVVVKDAKVCVIENTSTGFESVVTGEMEITLGQIKVDGKIRIFAGMSGTNIDIWASDDISPIKVMFLAKTSMNYVDLSDKQCTLSDIKELDLNIPVPQITKVDHTTNSVADSILSPGSVMDDYINNYLKQEMQTGVNSAWSTGGIEDKLEKLVTTSIKQELDGLSTTCPACAPGQSGNPIVGCEEINACVAHDCPSKNELCKDKPAPAPDSDTGRTCEPCGDGTRPSTSKCVDCGVGSAGRDGYCAQCSSTKNEYADGPRLSECKVSTTCRAGESVSFPDSPAKSRTCETIDITEGNFTDGPNQVKRAWSTCEAGEYEAAPGTTSSDRDCESCPDDKYQPTADQPSCLPLRVCQPGSKVVRTPSAINNRECAECDDGFFSNTTNAPNCTQHQTCANNQYRKNNGSKTTDHICGDHGDCVEGEYVKEEPTSTSARVCDSCGDGTFSGTINAPKCRPWKNCSAGYSVEEEPTISVDRKCAKCLAGEFSTTQNAAECQPWTVCLPGEFDKSTGITTSDRTCGACGFGEFSPVINSAKCTVGKLCSPGSEVNEIATLGDDTTCQKCLEDSFSNATMLQCQPHTTCLAGEYISSASSSTIDRSCAPCVSGTFSSNTNTASCTTYTDCKDSTVLFAGAATSDRTCNEATIVSDEPKPPASSGMVVGFAVGGILIFVLVAVLMVVSLKHGKRGRASMHAIAATANREEVCINPVYDEMMGQQTKFPPTELALYETPVLQSHSEDKSFGYADVSEPTTYDTANLGQNKSPPSEVGTYETPVLQNDSEGKTSGYADISEPTTYDGGNLSSENDAAQYDLDGFTDGNPSSSGDYMDVSPRDDTGGVKYDRVGFMSGNTTAPYDAIVDMSGNQPSSDDNGAPPYDALVDMSGNQPSSDDNGAAPYDAIVDMHSLNHGNPPLRGGNDAAPYDLVGFMGGGDGAATYDVIA